MRPFRRRSSRFVYTVRDVAGEEPPVVTGEGLTWMERPSRRRVLKVGALTSAAMLWMRRAFAAPPNELRLEVYEYAQNVQIPNGGTTKAGIVEAYVYGSPAGQTAKLTTKVYLNGDELWHQHTGQVYLDASHIDADIWQRTKALGTYKIVAKTAEGANVETSFTRV